MNQFEERFYKIRDLLKTVEIFKVGYEDPRYILVNLNHTPFSYYISDTLEKWCWLYDARSIPFKEVLEKSPPEIQKELVYHLDLFR